MNFSPDFRVRFAEPEDAAALGEIEVQSWAETYDGLLTLPRKETQDPRSAAMRWRGLLRRTTAHPGDDVIAVLEWGERIVGYASAGFQRFKRHQRHYPGEIYALYILHEAQGQGGGRALWSACAQGLCARGLFAGTVWCLATNSHARSFYESLGGQLIDRRWIRDSVGRIPLVAYGWDELSDTFIDWAD